MVYHLHFLCSECGIVYPTDINKEFPDANLVDKSLAEVTTEDRVGSNVKALLERTDLRCWKGHLATGLTLRDLILRRPGE